MYELYDTSCDVLLPIKQHSLISNFLWLTTNVMVDISARGQDYDVTHCVVDKTMTSPIVSWTRL